MWIQSSVLKHYKKMEILRLLKPKELYFFDLTLRQDIALIDAFVQIVCFSEMYFVGNWCKNEVFCLCLDQIFCHIYCLPQRIQLYVCERRPRSEGKVFKTLRDQEDLEKFIQETYMDMWWAWGYILISLKLELDSPSLTVALILG